MKSKKCITIGLTGGIASGKTTVSNKFTELGIPVIDADIIAREIVEPHSAGLKQLIETFGESILDGENLNRSKLRIMVFNDANKLKEINAILHPLIKKEIKRQVNAVKTHYCVVVIPLLCESSQYKWLDRTLVVDVSRETQIKRLLKRDSINIELAKKMLKAQCTRKQRLNIANDVINNQSTLLQLYDRIESLDRLYKNL